MLPLRDLQKQFKHLYFGSIDNDLQSAIHQGNIPAKNLLQIYQNNFFISLTECLQNIYPTIQKLLGEDFFTATANIYIKNYPSTSSNIHQFGNHFAEFLINFPETASLKYLNEVALLEWAYHEAFHEEDSKLFDLTKLQNIPESKYGEIHFKLHPSARLFAFNYPIMRIWNLCHNNSNKNDSVNLEVGGENILIIRRNLEVTFDLLNNAEFAFLHACRNDLNFEHACRIALQVEAKFDINSFLQKHLLCGTIVNIEQLD